MKRITSILLAVLMVSASSHAANIFWVTFHPDDNVPSANAALAGFTRAPDVGYTEFLRNAGHTVTRVVSTDIPNSALLNSGDLVIISRSVASGNYELDAETAAWNGLTVPTIILNGYIMRSSRLGYTTGTVIPDTDGAIRLTANNAAHPIFQGIALDGGNSMLNPFALSGTNGSILGPNGVLQRGISINTSPLAGGGTVLATVASDPNLTGGMIIGEWQAGATMGNGPNNGGPAPADTLGGHRLVFLTGTREQGITAEGAGIYDLASDGGQLFLNAVNYMAVPEPSSCVLLGFGALALLWRWRKR